MCRSVKSEAREQQPGDAVAIRLARCRERGGEAVAEATSVRLYGYRWVVLGVFSLINALVQMNWITFAAVTGDAAAYYRVSELEIGLLSMVFMIVFIIMSIPASYIIDTYGIRVGVGIGAVLTGVFGLTRGIWASDYTLVLVSQIGLAVGQPFVMNAITKVGARWFPITERATAAALPSLAQFIGIIVAMAATPYLVSSFAMSGMLMAYGVASMIGAVAALVLIRERPVTAPSEADQMERFKVFEGLRHILKQKDMLILLLLFFVGLGMFNAISTWIEQIVSPRGFGPEQAGVIGAVMVIGGILGAGILSVLSDRSRRRKPFLVMAVAGMAPGLVGLAFAASYPLLLVSSFVFGFFMMSAYPLGFQYSAEIGYPAPESTSQGIIVMAGQVSGILFILGMDAFKSDVTGSMAGSMLVFIALTTIVIALTGFLDESPMIRAEREKATV
ncbi:MAG: major facilitator superfamily domain-containing protein 7 [Actinobacteria bacterium]|nr:major facilitator superfamily domain-containing protein 7 [Actinomycetota bacterium]